MKANPKTKADSKAAEPAPGGSGKKMMIIIIGAVVLLLAVGGGGAWFFLHGKSDDGGSKAKHKEVVKSGPPVFQVVEPFTVNLQPGENGTDQYLQLAFTLQVPGLEDAEVIKNNMPKVRSRMLLLLSGKHAADINTPEGKKQLSAEIIALIKEPFEEHGAPQEVIDVLFTSFIIQ